MCLPRGCLGLKSPFDRLHDTLAFGQGIVEALSRHAAVSLYPYGSLGNGSFLLSLSVHRTAIRAGVDNRLESFIGPV